MDGFDLLMREVPTLVSEFAGVAYFLLAIVFAWAGIWKLSNPMDAAMALVDFRIARNLRPMNGYLVGIFELLLALALVAPRTMLLALPIAAMALGVFSFLLGRALLEGKDFPCGCAGSGGSLARSLARSVVLLLIAAAILWVRPDANHLLSERVASFAMSASVIGISWLVASVVTMIRGPIPMASEGR